MKRLHPCIKAVRWQPKRLPPMVALTYEQHYARAAVLASAERMGYRTEPLARMSFPELLRAWSVMVEMHREGLTRSPEE